MITCDNCYTPKNKLTFCSDKCRVQYHRKHDHKPQRPIKELRQSIKQNATPSPHLTVDQKDKSRLHNNLNAESYL